MSHGKRACIIKNAQNKIIEKKNEIILRSQFQTLSSAININELRITNERVEKGLSLSLRNVNNTSTTIKSKANKATNKR